MFVFYLIEIGSRIIMILSLPTQCNSEERTLEPASFSANKQAASNTQSLRSVFLQRHVLFLINPFPQSSRTHHTLNSYTENHYYVYIYPLDTRHSTLM